MTAVGVAVVQFAPSTAIGTNLDEMERLGEVAVSRGARVIVYPEYSSYFVDPFDDTLAAHAQEVDGSFAGRLRAFADRHAVVVVAGLLERGSDGSRVRNTVVAVDASGVVAAYRKAHLYDAFGQRESDWVEPGDLSEPETFCVDRLRFGLMTCYDLRFPESSRVLADAGVDVALVPADWVRGPLKEHQWQTLLTARAIENTMFVAGADHPPPLGVGHSAIIDPQGVRIATVGTGTDVAVAVVDRDALDRVRRINPALALRRYRVSPR